MHDSRALWLEVEVRRKAMVLGNDGWALQSSQLAVRVKIVGAE